MSRAVLKIQKADKEYEDFSFQFNPTDYTITTGVKYQSVNSANKEEQKQKQISGTQQTLALKLFLDTSEMKALNDAGNITVYQEKDVSEYTNRLIKMLYVKPDIKEGMPTVIFQWGSMEFEGYVENISIHFVELANDGSGMPVKAEVSLSIVSKSVEIKAVAKGDIPAVDAARAKMVKDGDNIFSLANEAYGSTAEWRNIATANNIEKPLASMIGKTLRI